MKDTKKFLTHYHYFRAFAILNIVFAHIWEYPLLGKRNASSELLVDIRELFFDGSTIYFIYISGFLFHYLSSDFRPVKYYINKCKNVVAPYVIQSISMLFLLAFFGTIRDTSIIGFLKSIPISLLNGTAQGQYWYIPFIITVFAISPVLLKLSKTRFSKYFPLLFLLPLLGTRTGMDITIFQYLYFLPVYIMGMYNSMHSKSFDLRIESNKKYIIIILVISLTSIFYLLRSKLYLELSHFYESLVFLKCISMTFLALIILKKLENANLLFLDKLATYSFAIYFTHFFIHNKLFVSYTIVGSYLPDELKFVFSILYLAVFVFLNLGLCILAKKILGKYSRYVIGA